ncbi:exodeoxyribonuclease VII large subunit [Aquibacillus koreensis]|uniref:Exodeoxyribonuclease 7 large subunit n=1 Tax=Aquibacillus koreensis TaxID=279446 RepID=A0A9X4AGH8_9BACI|nr:exodeoxyribonuclease VII large subunit [Aquibacillus koreensis]MCT2537515.1 exodeoxyribonuclease VII large subunit [Aquibacillus koreensis]MDC3418961.1 exodeoxyribonuclease VII large subunit [Aquibacillus koreensis]
MNDKYLTVTALTRYMKRKFEMDSHLKEVWLKGEISNFKHHSRGHMYFTIKDDYSRIQAVMFAGNNRNLKFRPENGMNVLLKGEINIYEPQGQYQLYIQQMEPDGIGALYLAYEQLKEKLAAEGLFDPLRKKSIPVYPKHIGVITSPTGAAVRDIITTIRRRFPIVQVTIIPALVQGDQAPKSIVKAIQFANQSPNFDVLIVGRGGGSIEELWSFNEEIVARSIAQSHIPIISAVGHETDFTISDLVADIRAATPTGAAEIAVPSQQELIEKVHHLERSLKRVINDQIVRNKERLNKMKKSYAFRYPEQLIKQKEQQLDKNVDRLGRGIAQLQDQRRSSYTYLQKRLIQQHPDKQVKQLNNHLQQLLTRHHRSFQSIFRDHDKRFGTMIDKLSLLNPLNTMKRGYSISYTDEGKVISSITSVQPGDKMTVKVVDGSLDCQVWGIEEETNNDK